MAGNPQVRTDAFTEFVKEVESRLQPALIARYGLQDNSGRPNPARGEVLCHPDNCGDRL